jgi:pimeloyl-ACP methyl ester carboxylesterase
MLRSFDAGRLFGARTGSSPPWTLALHGWRRTHRDFDAVLGALPATPEGGPEPPLDAVALDLPGFGASPPPPEGWGSNGYARAVVPVLESMAEEAGSPVVVLGHSFGGRVAVRLAAGWPDLVAGLVLSGVPRLAQVGAGARRAPLPLRLAKQAHRRGLLPGATVERLRYRYGSADYRQAVGVMREVFVRLVNERYDEDMARLEGPVELVWGERDTEVPVEVARAAADLLDGRANLTLCPGAGHLTPIEVPGALRQALLRQRPQ